MIDGWNILLKKIYVIFQVTLLKQGKEVPEEMVQRGEGAASKSAKTDDNGVADYQDERVLEKKVHLTHCYLFSGLVVQVFFRVA